MGVILSILAPIAGFLLLAIGRDRWHERAATVIGVGSILLAFLGFLSALLGFDGVAVYHMWNWMTVGEFSAEIAFKLDGLSLTLMGIITGVGLLIHLFASWYMQGDKGFSRFFSYLNLFVASMLILVLADNLLLMYLGWEGVGICSYMLIGFYYHERKNGRAAIKAFTVTRLGDVFLAVGLFSLYLLFGTLSIDAINQHGADHQGWLLTFAAMMLVGGAWGKSAQLPLHTWLADAMAGPTPVSALIHAATMVTAGVYLIARMHPIFVLNTHILLYWVGGVGAISMLVASFAALAQTDIKRILAYSTMSQLGYMFIALGVGAYQVAIFHLMTHAFFKALLFLASGAVIVSLHHEQNIFKMGGLAKKLPLVFAAFIVGGGALVAIPFVTVGFYSKEAILWETFAAGHKALFWAGVFGAALTALYTYRLIWLTFFGAAKTHAEPLSSWRYALPLGVLIVLSTGLGALIHPPLADVLPQSLGVLLEEQNLAHGKHSAEIIAMIATAIGLVLGFLLYTVNDGRMLARFKASGIGAGLYHWCYYGLGFDALYDLLFVKPFLGLARAVKNDPIDKIMNIFAILANIGNKLLLKTQNGLLTSHATSFGAGLVLVIVLALIKVV